MTLFFLVHEYQDGYVVREVSPKPVPSRGYGYRSNGPYCRPDMNDIFFNIV